MRIKGISRQLVDILKSETDDLSQGRGVACIGYVDDKGVITEYSDLVPGGIGGIPLRMLFNTVAEVDRKPLIDGISQLPNNSVIITTKPGETGLITDIGGIDLFYLPIVSIGVKMNKIAGISVVYPEGRLFDLATQAEQVEIHRLAAKDMKEEREVIAQSIQLNMEFLDISTSIDIIDIPASIREKNIDSKHTRNRESRFDVKGIDKAFAEELVAASVAVGQGREVAVIGTLDKDGMIRKCGEIVEGGIGYVPARLLASSGADITNKSLYQIYQQELPESSVIVHTHPGGTGVMHMGDASAGPITWGKPIVAIGHDKDGKIKGATIIVPDEKCMILADEYEELGQEFFDAQTKDQESEVRNRRFGIAQEYTNLSQEIEFVEVM